MFVDEEGAEARFQHGGTENTALHKEPQCLCVEKNCEK